ncbi:VWA domain-containing protein [Saccharicrinis sp. FJH62]|uniref:vWA domain-containing protein n=1 Tax=Saccharicrinis sp. FJH62 TaxID=3344657 RepID=UPI0035D4CC07
MGHLIFANPHYLFLLLLILPAVAWYVLNLKKNTATLQVSSLRGFGQVKKSYKYYLRHLPFILRMLAIAAIILVIARPQSTNSWQETDTEGIDIVLSMDISGSMLAEDLKPNRLEASIDVATQFINGRPDDNIGLVVFAGEAFTQCPLTTDHAVLINLFKDIPSIQLEQGTAIGMGLATAVARIKDGKAKSKVIILLTDGENNAGEVPPQTAAEMAKTYGVRVYTIGVGTRGKARVPIQTPYGTTQYQMMDVNLDEGLLRNIASTTGGKYFRATDNESLKAIYKEIDQLEKTKLDVKQFNKRTEEFFFFAMLAAIFILAEILLRLTVLRTMP